MAYLDDHPNRRLAQQRPRRDKPSGLIVVHTAESALDEIGADTGAEGVARFISERTTYGSYHRLADSDSIVPVARFEMTTYGDGTGSNDFAIHISAACRAADWPRMSKARRDAFVRNMAAAAAEAAEWLERVHGIKVPAKRVSRSESDRRVPGFISHGERDPGRRTDPGPEFPWSDFLSHYSALTSPKGLVMDSEVKAAFDALNEKVDAMAKDVARSKQFLAYSRKRELLTNKRLKDLGLTSEQIEATLEEIAAGGSGEA